MAAIILRPLIIYGIVEVVNHIIHRGRDRTRSRSRSRHRHRHSSRRRHREDGRDKAYRRRDQDSPVGEWEMPDDSDDEHVARPVLKITDRAWTEASAQRWIKDNGPPESLRHNGRLMIEGPTANSSSPEGGDDASHDRRMSRGSGGGGGGSGGGNGRGGYDGADFNQRGRLDRNASSRSYDENRRYPDSRHNDQRRRDRNDNGNGGGSGRHGGRGRHRDSDGNGNPYGGQWL